MKTIDLRNSLKNMKTGDKVITSKGFTFQKTKIGYRDLKTKLNWHINAQDGKYTYDQAMKEFKYINKCLPTIEEFKKAEEHGFREILNDMKNRWFWSASLDPNNEGYARVFDGYYGSSYVDFRYYGYGSVRCVGR